MGQNDARGDSWTAQRILRQGAKEPGLVGDQLRHASNSHRKKCHEVSQYIAGLFGQLIAGAPQGYPIVNPQGAAKAPLSFHADTQNNESSS